MLESLHEPGFRRFLNPTKKAIVFVLEKTRWEKYIFLSKTEASLFAKAQRKLGFSVEIGSKADFFDGGSLSSVMSKHNKEIRQQGRLKA